MNNKEILEYVIKKWYAWDGIADVHRIIAQEVLADIIEQLASNKYIILKDGACRSCYADDPYEYSGFVEGYVCVKCLHAQWVKDKRVQDKRDCCITPVQQPV